MEEKKCGNRKIKKEKNTSGVLSIMNTFARSIPRTVRSLTQRWSFQVHDSRYMRRAKSLLLGSRTSSTFAAYVLWLAVKMMTSNISDTFVRNSWRKGLFRTYTVSNLFVIIWNVKSASQFSKEECTKVSAEKYIVYKQITNHKIVWR